MRDIFINYKELKKDYKVSADEEALIKLAEEMNKVEDEFEEMGGGICTIFG